MSGNRLTIFDTTLRDGEQAPGFSMRIDEKLKLARQLATLGVDIIEAGFPIASEAERSARSRRRCTDRSSRVWPAAVPAISIGPAKRWRRRRDAASTCSSQPLIFTSSESCG